MRTLIRKAWERGSALLPLEGFHFGRPLVLFQSDDWGRVGVRDESGWEELRSLGVPLGERAYDFYSLEKADDVNALVSLLNRHRDSSGRSPCMEMNFILANVDFAPVRADDFRRIHLRHLNEGLPDGWDRPGLFAAYQSGIAEGVLSPALHGVTHFCRTAVQRQLDNLGERSALLKTFWTAGVPYIYWRMPWVGFEYADPGEDERETFLGGEIQTELISKATETFTKCFSTSPRSACAPGYRANRETHRAWVNAGIQVAQNGPGKLRPPHLESYPNKGGVEQKLLHIYRTVDFEPANDPQFSMDACLRSAADSIARGIPVIVSVHSINFHSSLRDFLSPTLRCLDEFLTVLESQYPNLLYVRDEDLYELVDKGEFESLNATLRVPVTKHLSIAG